LFAEGGDKFFSSSKKKYYKKIVNIFVGYKNFQKLELLISVSFKSKMNLSRGQIA
jgi:hypothetical protein